MTSPLVLVTRPAGARDPLVVALRSRGYRVAAVPTVVTQPAPAGGPLDQALAPQHAWDWVVVTSASGARAVGEALRRNRAAGGIADAACWAAIGPSTHAALGALGIHVDLVPRTSTGHELARELAARSELRGLRVLLARADAASADLPAALREAGALVHDVVAYHTVAAPPESAVAALHALADEDLAAVVVASGSAVRGLIALASESGLRSRVIATPLISIGPTTTAVAHDLGFTTVVEANQPSVDGLAMAVDATLGHPSPVAATSGRTR